MIAAGVRETDLGAYQRAARTLLVHPLVTATHPDADALRLVRRFAPDLAADLDEVGGYRLELAATSARLVKPLDRLDPTQVVRAPGKRPFDRRRYAYLALVLGALGRAGPQVALSELADGLRRRAADVPGLGFDPVEYRNRLAFVDVVLYLESLRALVSLEASSVTYVQDPDAAEALYDVDRDVVHQLFVPPRVLQHVGSVTALLAGDGAASRDARRASSRQRLCRLLLELPTVYLDDLDTSDRAYLLSQARSLATDLGRLTGGQLERRAEGVALIDATGGFSDRRFPTGGTPAQVALLLAAAMADVAGRADAERATVPTAAVVGRHLAGALDRARPTATDEVASGSTSGADRAGVDRADVDVDVDAHAPDADADADPPTGPLLADAWLREVVDRLVLTHGATFSADLRDDPATLLRAAVDVLAAFDLVRVVPGGVVARPAIARYRLPSVTVVGGAQMSLLDAGGAP